MAKFVDNVDAVVRSIGATDVGLVWGLANVRWESDDDRDAFLAELTNSA